MKKALILSLILMFALVGNAMAISWTYAGSVFDQEIFDYNNDWSPISYPNVPSNTPSPGGSSGEGFDLEGGKCAMDDDYIYFAITSSFENGVLYDGYTYLRGDFFFGFDGSDTQFGIDFGGNGVYAVGSNYNLIPETPLGYYSYPSIKAAVGAYSINDGAGLLGYADDAMHSGLTETTAGDTYVLEYRISKSLFANYGLDYNNLTVSYRGTVACGNDVLVGECDLSAVPEPATLALLGLGLLGGGLIARRRK